MVGLRRLCLLLVIVAILPNPCFADAGVMTLSEMAHYSDYIVVGKVISTTVSGKKVAEVEVTRTLKGNPNVKRLYYYFGPSWMCDVSDAKEGETAIYFLSAYSSKVEVMPGVPLFELVHSGRGRLIVHCIDGEPYIRAYRRGDVLFPRSITVAIYPNPKDFDLGLLRLEDVIRYVEGRGRRNRAA